jgi:WD40 repeat protein
LYCNLEFGSLKNSNIHFWNSTTSGKVATIETESQVTSLQWSREYKEIASTHGFPNNLINIWEMN